MVRCGVAVLALLFSIDASAEELRVRVLSYNVWGIPVITPLREQRMAAISEKLRELRPDLASFQEVWTDDDAATLSRGLAEIGLVHVKRFVRDWPDDSGLLIASRYPIEEVEFLAFTQGRYPHVLWHVDYMAGKGVGSIRVKTPVGVVRFVDTHLQARYGTDDYLFVQMNQALEAAEHLRTETAPIILAGDINSNHEGLPSKLLISRGLFTPTDDDAGIDQILHRSGDHLRVRTVSIRRALTEAVDFGEVEIPPSDHPALLAELVIETCDGPCEPAALRATIAEMSSHVLPLVRSEMDLRSFNMSRDLLLALLLPVGSFLMLRSSRRRRLLKIPALLLLLAAIWFGYLCTTFGPSHLAGLAEIQGRLSAAKIATAVSERGS